MISLAYFAVLLLSAIWMLICFSAWWPGILHIDSIYYLTEILINRSELTVYSNESYLYALLMKFSATIGGGFEILIGTQILAMVLLISDFYSFQIDRLKNSLWVSGIVLGAVLFPAGSMMLLNVERDIPYVLCLVWLLLMQMKMIYSREGLSRRGSLLFCMGFTLVLACSFKQTGFLAVPFVFMQMYFLKLTKRDWLIFAKSFGGFGFLFFVLIPFLLGVVPSKWPVGFGYFAHVEKYSVSPEPGLYYHPQAGVVPKSLEQTISKLRYARAQGISAPADYLAIAKLDRSYEEVISRLGLAQPKGFTAGKEAFLKALEWLNSREWSFLLFQTFFLGEVILLLVALSGYWFRRTFLLALLPISQYALTALLQPVGKGRYFYFIFLVPFFLLPLFFQEIRTRLVGGSDMRE